MLGYGKTTGRNSVDRLRQLLEKYTPLKGAFCLQIGGCDGFQDDPVDSFRAELGGGLVVEPVPSLAAELRENLPAGWDVEESAVLDYSGRGEIIHYRYDSNDTWQKGISTFFPEKNCMGGFHGLGLLKKLEPRTAALIKERSEPLAVNVITLQDLVSKWRLTKIDLLVIDTEGAEMLIIDQWDFSRINPFVILLEYHNHSDEDKKRIWERLASAGYNLKIEGVDLTAYLRNP